MAESTQGGFYARRVAGGDRDHRHPDRPVVAGRQCGIESRRGASRARTTCSRLPWPLTSTKRANRQYPMNWGRLPPVGTPTPRPARTSAVGVSWLAALLPNLDIGPLYSQAALGHDPTRLSARLRRLSPWDIRILARESTTSRSLHSDQHLSLSVGYVSAARSGTSARQRHVVCHDELQSLCGKQLGRRRRPAICGDQLGRGDGMHGSHGRRGSRQRRYLPRRRNEHAGAAPRS